MCVERGGASWNIPVVCCHLCACAGFITICAILSLVFFSVLNNISLFVSAPACTLRHPHLPSSLYAPCIQSCTKYVEPTFRKIISPPSVVPEHCLNGIKDFDELGVDCGGECARQCGYEVPRWKLDVENSEKGGSVHFKGYRKTEVDHRYTEVVKEA